MFPEPVREWLARNGYGTVSAVAPVGGGCINNGMRLVTSSGERFFLKVNPQAPADMFEREAEGLQALHVPLAPRTPRPYHFDSGFLLMEDLYPARRSTNYWLNFGRQLASLHLHTVDRYGFMHDNYIGSTPQPNPWYEDGAKFFAEQRLLYQAELAHRRGLISRNEIRNLENLAGRLEGFIPFQPASLIHGDLWSGNIISDQHGNPAIIDPAAYYGWAEADLAMMTLFGSFPDEFIRAYQEVRPLDAGFAERFPIYNLYHLINHVNLFGDIYLGQVISILKKYG